MSASSILSSNTIDPSQHLQLQPMLDMEYHPDYNNVSTASGSGGNPLVEALPTGYYVHSSQPDSVLGFSTWPPESWETLFNDTSLPGFVENPNLGIDMPFNSLTPRMQESAERGQLSLASAALVVKLSNSFPVSLCSTTPPFLSPD